MKITPLVKALLAKLPPVETFTYIVLDNSLVVTKYQRDVLISRLGFDFARFSEHESVCCEKDLAFFDDWFRKRFG